MPRHCPGVGHRDGELAILSVDIGRVARDSDDRFIRTFAVHRHQRHVAVLIHVDQVRDEFLGRLTQRVHESLKA